MVGMMNAKMENNVGGGQAAALQAAMQQQMASSSASAMQMNNLRSQAMLASTLGNFLLVIVVGLMHCI